MKLPDPVRGKQYFSDVLEFTADPIAVDRLIKDGSIALVDVRAADDYAKEHIPGSINLPRDQWSKPEGLAKDKPVVVLCYNQTCHLAAKACFKLASLGYPVTLMEGGFKTWKDFRLPVEAGKAAA